jgi:type VI secretion system protein ImpF
MTQLTAPERIQPCLLDRLLDDEPDKKQESSKDRVVSDKKYRQGVLRDFDWLFNTYGAINPDGTAYLREGRPERFGSEPQKEPLDLRKYPEAFRSVINYGLKQLWGLTLRDKGPIQDEIREAILLFEPRIKPDSLVIEIVNPGEQAGQRTSRKIDGAMIEIIIQGELWTNERLEQLQLKTAVDLEMGQCSLGDASHG